MSLFGYFIFTVVTHSSCLQLHLPWESNISGLTVRTKLKNPSCESKSYAVRDCTKGTKAETKVLMFVHSVRDKAATQKLAAQPLTVDATTAGRVLKKTEQSQGMVVQQQGERL